LTVTHGTAEPTLPRPAAAPAPGPLDSTFYDLAEGRFRRLVRHEPIAATYFGIHAYDDQLGDGGRDTILAEVAADREQFVRRRRVKNEAELAGIRRAQRAAEAAMDAARELLRSAERQNGSLLLDGEELTCERLKLAVEQAFTANGAFADEFIVSHGAQTAVGHDMGSGPILPDEPICLDLFPRDRDSGCFADMTRVFVVGTPSDELLEWHKLCKEALDRSVAAAKPGIPGTDLFKITCDVFEEHGYPTLRSKQPGEVLQDGFYHSLGHGVGLEVHEEPTLGRAPGELVAGDVIAVEPGLYRHGIGGCRLEDLVLVTENGPEVLTDYPYDLEP